MPQPRTFVVTGGAGFVGANLAAELSRREPKSHVVVIDPFRSGSYANIVEAHSRRRLPPFAGEVIPESSAQIDWLWLVERLAPAAVFHLGAITDTTIADERLMLQENVNGFSGMLEALAEARIPLVYASSAATYGTPPQTRARAAFPEAAAGCPNNVYGFSKWLMECEHERAAAARPGSHVVGLRYFNVFGPGEARKGKMASMVLQLARQLLAGNAPRLFRDGSQSRDQVYVDDVVDCTLHASGLFGGLPRPGVYNLGSGVATSFNQIIDSLRAALGVRAGELATEYFDMPASVRAFYQDFTLADMSAAAEGLGWRPSHPPGEAIAVYARWLRKNDPAAPLA
jgi:ADP-L-glycero-D-manno-heptose 6-epimerase